MSTDIDIIIALARKLEAENTRLRAENAALRAGQGTWPTEQPDDFPCCSGERLPESVKPVDTSPATLKENGENFTRPLTVHALNVAPGDSILRHPTKHVYRIKHLGYWWISGEETLSEPLSPEELLAYASGWADATLHHPERGDHE